MNRNYLLETAKHLQTVSKSCSAEYENKGNELISKMNETMLNRPDVKDLVGEKNLDMMKDNHANHIRFISSLIKSYHPEVFVDTVLWVFSAYQNHGFSSQYWSAQLNTWIDLMKTTFTEDTFNEVFPYYEWMQVNIPTFVKVSQEITEAPESAEH